MRLMLKEALQRLDDAEVLHQSIGFTSRTDSVHLLKLLGFELLLKLVYEVALNKKSNHGHDYKKIFEHLPQSLQSKLLTLASQRIGPSALTENSSSILKEWSANFIALRYPYERYESLTEEQYTELGEQWIAKGASLNDATFRFYPEELFGMLHALRLVAEKMASQSFCRSDFENL